MVGENMVVVNSTAHGFCGAVCWFQRLGDLKSRVGFPSLSIAGLSCDACQARPTAAAFNGKFVHFR